MVSPGGGRSALPDRRYLVADGDRRNTDHADSGRNRSQAGLRHAAFFWRQAGHRRQDGRILEGACEGNLVLLDSWPGQMRTVYGDHERFTETYFKTFPGMYFTGDGARRDEDGYYWITGRVDDVINVAGHRLGTAEVESGARLPSQGLGASAGCLVSPFPAASINAFAARTTLSGAKSQRRRMSTRAFCIASRSGCWRVKACKRSMIA